MPYPIPLACVPINTYAHLNEVHVTYAVLYRVCRMEKKTVDAAFVGKKSHSREEQMELVCASRGGQKLMKRQAVAYWKRFNERAQQRLFIWYSFTVFLTRSAEWWKISVHGIVVYQHQQLYGLDDQLMRKARVKENSKFDSERINSRRRRSKKNAMWMHANNVWIELRLAGGHRWQRWRRPQRQSANEMKTPLKQTRHGWFVCLIKYNVSSIRLRALLLAASQRDRVRLRSLQCVLAVGAVIDWLCRCDSGYLRLTYYSCGVDDLRALWPQTSTPSSRRFKRDSANGLH